MILTICDLFDFRRKENICTGWCSTLRVPRRRPFGLRKPGREQIQTWRGTMIDLASVLYTHVRYGNPCSLY